MSSFRPFQLRTQANHLKQVVVRSRASVVQTSESGHSAVAMGWAGRTLRRSSCQEAMAQLPNTRNKFCILEEGRQLASSDEFCDWKTRSYCRTCVCSVSRSNKRAAHFLRHRNESESCLVLAPTSNTFKSVRSAYACSTTQQEMCAWNCSCWETVNTSPHVANRLRKT